MNPGQGQSAPGQGPSPANYTSNPNTQGYPNTQYHKWWGLDNKSTKCQDNMLLRKRVDKLEFG